MHRWKKAAVCAATLIAGVSAGAAWAAANTAGSPAPGVADSPALLGSGVTESKFVPVTPCRLVDTRLAGGPLGNNQTRAFDVRGTGATFAAQGGKADGCGIPNSGVSGVEITVTAVSSEGSGFLRIYPGTVEPTATFLNHTDTFNASNTGTVSICGFDGSKCTADQDLKVRDHGLATEVVIDVQGYYSQPVAATVKADGTLVDSSRASAATRVSTGRYRVTFDREITDCAITGAIGDPVLPGNLNGEFHVQFDNTDDHAAYVSTHDSTGMFADRPFTVLVTC